LHPNTTELAANIHFSPLDSIFTPPINTLTHDHYQSSW
jgi:hypothetical protein